MEVTVSRSQGLDSVESKEGALYRPVETSLTISEKVRSSDSNSL